MGESEKLVESFGACIRPSMLICRPREQIILLAKRYRYAFAVNLRSTGYQHTLAVLGTFAEDDVGAVKDRLDGLYRLLHDKADPDSAGHVVDPVSVFDELLH